MSEKPIISVVAAAVRPQFWMELYDSLTCANQVPFELVFCGNKRPDFELPENFHFIYSEVKPAQCWEIASRHAIGEYIMHIADDFLYSEGTLNWLYFWARRLKDRRVIVSCRYKNNGIIQDEALCFNTSNPDSPIALNHGLMRRDTWEEIGGIDRRFISLYWDLDIFMRIYKIGGFPFISPNSIAEERSGNDLLGGYLPIDRELLDSFWITADGSYSETRLAPVEPFDDKDIITVSQGNKGEW